MCILKSECAQTHEKVKQKKIMKETRCLVTWGDCEVIQKTNQFEGKCGFLVMNLLEKQ